MIASRGRHEFFVPSQVLLIHGESLLIQVLNARLVAVRLDHLLEATGKRPLDDAFRLGLDELVLASHGVLLLLATRLGTVRHQVRD